MSAHQVFIKNRNSISLLGSIKQLGFFQSRKKTFVIAKKNENGNS